MQTLVEWVLFLCFKYITKSRENFDKIVTPTLIEMDEGDTFPEFLCWFDDHSQGT